MLVTEKIGVREAARADLHAVEAVRGEVLPFLIEAGDAEPVGILFPHLAQIPVLRAVDLLLRDDGSVHACEIHV